MSKVISASVMLCLRALGCPQSFIDSVAELENIITELKVENKRLQDDRVSLAKEIANLTGNYLEVLKDATKHDAGWEELCKNNDALRKQNVKFNGIIHDLKRECQQRHKVKEAAEWFTECNNTSYTLIRPSITARAELFAIWKRSCDDLEKATNNFYLPSPTPFPDPRLGS